MKKYIKNELNEKLKEIDKELNDTLQIDDKHVKYIFFLYTASYSKIFHLSRTILPEHADDFAIKFDKLIGNTFIKIYGAPIANKRWLQYQLSTKFGRLGLCTLYPHKMRVLHLPFYRA